MSALSSSAEDVFAVILAGGSGTRFWPKSRHLRPKQLCRLGGQEMTMIEMTLARLDGFIPPERRIIVTHKDQIQETKRLVGGRVKTYLAEPEAKNTANALALAALEIQELARGSQQIPVMISLHADHMIRDEARFRLDLLQATALAKDGKLTLLGVVPEYAETGFGYIERGEPVSGHRQGFNVASFREKPDFVTAKTYVESGKFYWNAGLFVWRVDVLIGELKRTLAASLEKLLQVLDTGAGSFTRVEPALLAEVYRSLPKISIDHAVLETSTNVAVVPTDVGWQDIGSWDGLARSFKADADGNLLFGDGVLLNSSGTTVDSDGPFVAALGVKDLVVVANGGAVLVCPKEKAQDVKKIVEWLEAKGRRELL